VRQIIVTTKHTKVTKEENVSLKNTGDFITRMQDIHHEGTVPQSRNQPIKIIFTTKVTKVTKEENVLLKNTGDLTTKARRTRIF
jgi:hypothetical protein